MTLDTSKPMEYYFSNYAAWVPIEKVAITSINGVDTLIFKVIGHKSGVEVLGNTHLTSVNLRNITREHTFYVNIFWDKMHNFLQTSMNLFDTIDSAEKAAKDYVNLNNNYEYIETCPVKFRR